MSGVYFLKFLKVIFLLSRFEKLHHSLFYLSILFLTFFSSTMFHIVHNLSTENACIVQHETRIYVNL